MRSDSLRCRRLIALAIGVVLALAVLTGLGCGPSTPGPAPRPSSVVPPEAEPIVREARRMLAERLGRDEGDATVVAVEPRDWPDTSLGCPQPGRTYAQVITPGFRIVLAIGAETYAFHASASHLMPCPAVRG